jgi:hypothetical protein
LFHGKVASLGKKPSLPPEAVMLIRVQVVRIDVCLFCIDIGCWFVSQESLTTRSAPLWTTRRN